MEIMGLAIIVILVSLGVLFSLSVINKQPENVQKGYEQKRLAVSMLNTLLSTTSQCQKNTFRQLLQDCAAEGLADCKPLPPPKNSCTYLKVTMPLLLKRVFDAEKKNWVLTVSGTSDVAMVESNMPGKKCKGDKDQATQIIPASLGGNVPITVKLDIC